jgi:hypothetical protein
MKALARYAATAFVPNLRALAPDRRIATLLAFVSTYLAVVHDDALDLFDALMNTTTSQLIITQKPKSPRDGSQKVVV